jgi:DNA-binding NarL/FixJ family response regulator
VDAKLLARADIDAGSPFARASGLRWVAIGDEPADVLGALRAGAKGCLARTGATEQLVTAVMETRAGHVFLGPEAAEIVVTTLREGPPGHALSPRELEVLGLMVEGLQSKVMASRLGVSIRTIGSHRRALSLKTGLHSVAELTRFALAHGLAGPPRT